MWIQQPHPFQDVQTLLLRRPTGPAVRHLVLSIPHGHGKAAARYLLRLHKAKRISFGPEAWQTVVCSLGFSHAGLEAMSLPPEYLRVFRALAPSFAAGAPARRTQVGDSVANAASPGADWPELALDRAHVLLTLHGPAEDLDAAVRCLTVQWRRVLGRSCRGHPCFRVVQGEHLPAPSGKYGRWAHFGLRDDLSDIAIEPLDQLPPLALAPDHREHAPGALLLGHPDDLQVNRWALPRAPDEVRRFFRNASFGVFRPATQDLAAFEAAVERWAHQVTARVGAQCSHQQARDLVKAKLSGRWPDGQRIEPGQLQPKALPTNADFRLGLLHEQASTLCGRGRLAEADTLGQGCPFGSHVRRLQARPDRAGALRPRPLLRRSVPYGAASWDAPPTDGQDRGQLGHFFCADLGAQFEEMLGLWAAASPPGRNPEDKALDPLIGPHDDPGARLQVPLQGLGDLWLDNFQVFVRPLGLMYAWYPSEGALTTLLTDDFVPPENRGPWL